MTPQASLSTQDQPLRYWLLLVHAVLMKNVNLQLVNIYSLPCTIVVHDARFSPWQVAKDWC